MKTVLLTGTGSVANSWDPVHQALRKVFPDAPASEANSVFATLIYNLRFFSERGRDKRRRDIYLKQYRRLQEEIAECLRVATEKKHIWLRPEFHKIVNRFDIAFDNSHVITTNWDMLLDVDPFGHTAVYLHGKIDKPNRLFLPTEVARERYRTERTHEKRAEGTRQIIQEANRLVIYGLSLSPLDTELGILMSHATSSDKPKLSEVFIVDETPDPVATRARWYLTQNRPKLNLDFVLLRPSDVVGIPLSVLP